MTERPDLFWGMVASMWIGNLMLVIINLPLIGIWVQLLRVPYRLLYLAILLFCAIGVYTLNNNPFEVILTAVFGVLGYLLIRLECEPAPMLLGFVLGPLMEENLRRAMRISSGDPMIFLNRPISLGLLIAAALLLLRRRAAGDPRQARGGVPGGLRRRYGETSSSTRPLVSTANAAVMTAAKTATAANSQKHRLQSAGDHVADRGRPDHRGKAQPRGRGADAERADARRVELGRVEIDADVDRADEEIRDAHIASAPAPTSGSAMRRQQAEADRRRRRTRSRTTAAGRHSRWSARRSAYRTGRPPA